MIFKVDKSLPSLVLVLALVFALTTLLHSAPSRKLLPNASVSLELNCLVFKMN